MICLIKFKAGPRQINTSAELSTSISLLHRIPFIILPLCLQHNLKQKRYYLAFLNSQLLIIHIVSILKNSRRFYYFLILLGQIKTSFRDVSYFRSKYLCRSEKIQTEMRLELRFMAVQEQEQLGFGQKRQVIHLTKNKIYFWVQLNGRQVNDTATGVFLEDI